MIGQSDGRTVGRPAGGKDMVDGHNPATGWVRVMYVYFHFYVFVYAYMYIKY